MEHNNIDKLIKDKLEKAKFDHISADEIWQNIQPNITVTKNWWTNISLNIYFAIALISFIGLGVWYFTANSTENATVVAAVAETAANENKTSTAEPTAAPTENLHIASQEETYNPEITQINEVQMHANGNIVLENTLVYLEEKGDKYFVTVMADSIGLKIVTQPKNGKVNVDKATGKFSYQPNYNFYGIDSFRYALIYANGKQSNTATIKVNIAKPVAGTEKPVDTMAKNTEEAIDPPILPEILTKAENIEMNTIANNNLTIDVKKKLEL